MPARGEKRRAGRGNTHDPYECCGKEAGGWGRPKGQVCQDCAKLINDGKAARVKAEQDRAAGAVGIYQYHEVDYAAPGYYGLGIPSRGAGKDLGDELRAAQFQLVLAASVPAPATTTHYATDTGKDDWKHPWPHVLSVKETRHEWGTLVLMRPALRDAIDALDQVIRAVLPATYLAGKAAGRSVLLGLAKGDVSMADFDDALLTADERAEKQKARRGY